jgi:energy-coupling factor transport system ATP-binding protein
MPTMQMIRGANFSGRTQHMRQAVEVERNECDRAVVYIGPEVFNAFSGLASTPIDEFTVGADDSWEALAAELRVQDLLSRDIGTLSGGESSLCAIGVGLAARTRIVAIDCAMEQIDTDRREGLLRVIATSTAEQVMIADNRIAEWRTSWTGESFTVSGDSAERPWTKLRGDTEFPRPQRAERLSVQNVRHRYGKQPPILDGLDIEMSEGQILHLAGANGSGKSTLAKILVGALLPEAGQLHTAGGVISPLRSTSAFGGPFRRKRGALWDHPGRMFAYHFQHPDAQLFRRSVRDELLTGARRQGRPTADAERYAAAAARAFGLEGILAMHPHDLPFTMRKRIALASTLACGTPCIILDEPTLGQDDDSVCALADMIQRMTKEGTGFIIISHCETFVRMLGAGRVTLSQGKLRRREVLEHV